MSFLSIIDGFPIASLPVAKLSSITSPTQFLLLDIFDLCNLSIPRCVWHMPCHACMALKLHSKGPFWLVRHIVDVGTLFSYYFCCLNICIGSRFRHRIVLVFGMIWYCRRSSPDAASDGLGWWYIRMELSEIPFHYFFGRECSGRYRIDVESSNIIQHSSFPAWYNWSRSKIFKNWPSSLDRKDNILQPESSQKDGWH